MRRIKLLREFGAKMFAADFLSSNVRLPKITARWKDRVMLDWLKEHYADVIDRYKDRKEPCSEGECPVWSMWWQGEDDLPEVIRLCFANIRKHCGSHPFRVITQENFREYVHLPEYVLTKADAGIISLTHLSDIIRAYLLSHWGGMWIDATVLVTRDIDFGKNYWTIRRETDPCEFNVSMKRWSISVQRAVKGNVLWSFVLDMWLEYWKRQESLADYVMTDYMVALAYDALPQCRAMLEGVELSNPAFDDLQSILNDKWDAEKWEGLSRETQYFKLTYKHNFRKEIHGRETLYGYIMRNFA